MKHVTFGDKSLLMGDSAADTLMEYARMIADSHTADSVTLQAISPDGNTVAASFLLNASTSLLIESTNSAAVAPPNEPAEKYMRARLDAHANPRGPEPEVGWSAADDFDGDGQYL